MLKAAFFDIDGTLLDSNTFVYTAFDRILKKHNYPLIPWEEMAKLMGLELAYIYSQFAPNADANVLSQEHIDFQKENLHLTHSFPGSAELLQSLDEKNIRIAAVTSRSTATTQKSLDLTGLLPFFDLIYTLDDGKPKPDPQAINQALKLFALQKETAVMIGDTTTDIQTGKNAGVRTIGVTYGMHGENIKQANPDFLVESITELASLLENLIERR